MQLRRLTKTREIYRTSPAGNSMALTLPPEICDLFGWGPGVALAITVDQTKKRMILEAAVKASGVD
jgi:hypothetical protein